MPIEHAGEDVKLDAPATGAVPASTARAATAAAWLFDLDGTLTDSRPGIVASIRHALSRMGAPDPGDAALGACLGPPLRQSFARLLGTRDAASVDRAIDHYRERFADVGWRENAVYPGVAEVLARLAARGTPMLVCTSKPQVYATRIVEHFGLAPHFRAVHGPGLDGRHDDKRELLAHVLAQHGLRGGAATLVGDRDNDLAAARANGSAMIGVLWGYGSREELAGADALVETPAALAEVLVDGAGAGSDGLPLARE